MTRANKTGVRRREVLVGAGAGGLLLTGRKSARAQGTMIRYNITATNGSAMLTTYAKAVVAMKKLDPPLNSKGIPSKPLHPGGWLFQGFIHGVAATPLDPVNSPGLRHGSAGLKARIDEIYGNPPAGSPHAKWKEAASACWGTCPHGSSNFVSWHRWYVFYFEKTCRMMSGDPKFTLPYWDYASNKSSSLQLPALFQNTSSSLYESLRGDGFSSGAGTGARNVPMNSNGFMPYSQTDYNPAISPPSMFPADASGAAFPPDPAYFAFGHTGRVECQPHDNVHDNIGGLMSNVPVAAGDPVFFVHHCQIDRLWAAWQARSDATYNWGTGASGSASPSQSAWEAAAFSFVDINGNIVIETGSGELSIARMGYGYDSLPSLPSAVLAAASPASMRAAMAMPGQGVMLAAMVANQLVIGSGGGTATLKPATPPANAPLTATAQQPEPATLLLQDVKLVRRPPAPLEVFLNQPPGVAPELGSIYDVGKMSLFNWEVGSNGPMMHNAENGRPMPGEFSFPVAGVIARQKAAGVWKGGPANVTVSLLGAPAGQNQTFVTVGKVSLLP